MANAYADLATLKSAAILKLPDAAHDARLLQLLEAASRWIDGYCGRSFAATRAERRFDGSGQAALTVPDLIAVSSLRIRAATGHRPGTGAGYVSSLRIRAAGEWTAWPSAAACWCSTALNGGWASAGNS